MTSEHKFHLYVTVATVMVMYFMIENVAPFLNEFGVAKPIVTLLSTVGIYNLFVKTLSSLARNWLWLKKYLLGATFLNGTWVGEFKGSNNEKIITVEAFDQTLNHLVIRGESFKENGESYAQWISKATFINETDGVLTYTYTCDKDDDKSTFQGVCVFNFERAAAHLPPTYIKGYSTDVIDGVRTSNREKKIDDKLLPLLEAFELAKNA
ncbi:hypothetical protein PCNPT3_06265 [Psychromonas sp. CNPT3]|uniref:hypothetical protein n=1 Tax=Psychromonas sp. CNPT3 TaxID=314282 RepID=UPI00006E9CF5|nr:hypothetical protein [Psychromonas sp. CNPT3]AGH81193.1 hypothetical protein PCNPT3_06265 [Psychromonas sp. CNPT3]